MSTLKSFTASEATYNTDARTFLTVREPCGADIRNAFARVEAYIHQHHYVDRLGRRAVGEKLPPLFNITNKGGKEVFSYVRAGAVAEALAMESSKPARELSAMLMRSGRATEIARELLGQDLPAMFATIFRGRAIEQETIRPLEKLRHAAGLMPPDEFVLLLSDFGKLALQGCSLRFSVALLIALISEGCLLSPLTLWRGVYPGSGLPPQKYLEVIDHPKLLNAGKAEDINKFLSLVKRDTPSSQRDSVGRAGILLLHSTTARLHDLDVGAVAETINQFQEALLEAGETDHVRRLEVRKLLRETARLFGTTLIEAGRPAGTDLYRRETIDGGMEVRKAVYDTRSSLTFGFLNKQPAAITEATALLGNVEKPGFKERLQKSPIDDFSKWGQLLAEYVKQAPVSRVSSVLGPLLVFCDWLVSHGEGLQSPANLELSDILRTEDTTRRTTLLEYLDGRFSDESAQPSAAFGQTRLFLEWYQLHHNPTYLVPFRRSDQPSLPDYQGKTSKEALPVRIIKEMKAALSENDFAWAKKLKADYVKLDKPTWCPVRAYALYMLLELPLRTIQVRLLDSGEGDELRYDGATAKFKPNPHGQKGRQAGVLKEFFDRRAGRRFVGLHINTNKTQALYSASKRPGYDIMWENKPLIALLESLREWQAKFNPVDRPIHVNDCSDRRLHAPEKIAKVVQPVWFLFRDPASNRTNRWEPISHVRLESMYIDLLAEVERRFAKRGEDVKLISEWATSKGDEKKPIKAIVTLHCLRVSGITNFAEAGVPLHVLTEFLSGHSTILMNIWYQKFGFATIDEILRRASEVDMSTAGMAQFKRWMEDKVERETTEGANSEDAYMELCRNRLVGGSAGAFAAMQRHPAGFWAMDIDGLCPNGRTLCDEGGPRIGTKGWTRSTPTPGGRGNCPACRYWITGPMFIFGQVVKANVLLYHIQERSDAANKLRDDLDEIQVDDGGGPAITRKVSELRSAIDIIDTEISNGLDTWVRRYDYLMKSSELLTRTGSAGSKGERHPLITQGDSLAMEATATEGSRFDLLEFVNQACEFLPGVDVASARFKKTRLLDLMLERNGHSPLFFKLSEDEALKAGNALTRFMADVAGQKGAADVVEGKASPEQVGILGFDDLLNRSLERFGKRRAGSMEHHSRPLAMT